MSKKKKIIIIVICWCLGVLAALYVGVAVYFDQVFCANTVINGIDASYKKPEEVKELLAKQMEAYKLNIGTIEGESEEIKGEQIDFVYDYNCVDVLKKEEMGWIWPISFFRNTAYEAVPKNQYDPKKLEAVISQLKCVTQEQIAPVNASLKIDESGFDLKKAVKGNTIKKDVLLTTIETAISEGEKDVNLEAAGCYELPTVTEDSPEIQDELKKLDDLCSAKITYNFHGNEEVIDLEVIRKWVRKDEDGKYYIDRQAAYDYLDALAEKYDTVNSYREFKSSRGYTITVKPGSYGWGTDVDVEIDTLMDAIKNKKTETREPAYYMTPYHGISEDAKDDIGNTYIEIDLGNQYLYYYLNGSLFVSTPITSGTMSTGHATPEGVYFINSRKQNTILVGEDYKTPVNFWMQIVGGVGIHDSLWRSNYGGSEYINSGSHGCINTPYDAVSSIFWNVEVGVPVVMYY